MPVRAVEIIAHRGSSDDAPENTVASANLAWQRRADSVELDIHRTSDGKLVVIHDEDSGRTTGVKMLVAGSTAADLQKLDAGSWKSPAYAGEKIPLLDELLATGGPARRFVIEIKQGPEVLPELQACISRAALDPAQAVIISFNLEAAREAKRQLPRNPVFLIRGYDKFGANPGIDDLIAEAKGAGLDGLDLDSHWPIDSAFVEKIKSAGLLLWVWTVDDPAIARRLVSDGVDGITTNRPGPMRSAIFP